MKTSEPMVFALLLGYTILMFINLYGLILKDYYNVILFTLMISMLILAFTFLAILLGSRKKSSKSPGGSSFIGGKKGKDKGTGGFSQSKTKEDEYLDKLKL